MPERPVRAAAVAALGLCAAVGCAHGVRRTDAPAATPVDPSTTLQPVATVRRDKNVAEEAEWRGRSAQNVAELFEGRFPGVQAYVVPGGMVVRIRGATNLRGDGEPLYVVDGLAIASGAGGVVSLNPADVARIEVLKDAAHLAEYGSQGANGVIRITTKRPLRP